MKHLCYTKHFWYSVLGRYLAIRECPPFREKRLRKKCGKEYALSASVIYYCLTYLPMDVRGVNDVSNRAVGLEDGDATVSQYKPYNNELERLFLEELPCRNLKV